MRNSLQIHPMVLVVLFAGAFLSMASFAGCWYLRQSQLAELAEKETQLRDNLEQLDTWGKWTIDYVKIDKSLDYLSKGRLTPETKTLLTEQIWQISRSYSMDPLLILAVVAQESHGNPNARGRTRSGKESGALGLMQIKLETAQKMAMHFGLRIENSEDLLRPEVNVTVGTAYLIRLIGKYGSWKEALIAYNLGHSAVDKMLAKGIPLPTRYYEHVISKYWNLAQQSFL